MLLLTLLRLLLLLLLLRSLALLRRLLLLDKVVLLLLRVVELLLLLEVWLLESVLLERRLRLWLPEAVLLVEVAEVLRGRLERLLRLERRLLRRRLEAVLLLRLLPLELRLRLLLVVVVRRRVVGRNGRLERAQQLLRGSEEVGHLLGALLRLGGERIVAETRCHSEVSILQQTYGTFVAHWKRCFG